MTETLLTREQILQADDLQFEIVEVPEWGGSVRLRGLTGAERGTFQDSLITQDGRVATRKKGKNNSSVGVNIRQAEYRLVALCVVDEEGKRLFTDGDVKALGQKSGLALNRVSDVAMQLSGLGIEDLQELTENFDTTQSDDSGSD